MSGQIVNMNWREAVSEVALKCGDAFFRDFPKNIYSQAVFRAERAVAKRYGIMDRIWTYTNTAGSDEVDITPLNFNGEWRVTVTRTDTDAVTGLVTTYDLEYIKVPYEKVENPDDLVDTPDYRYSINYIGNRYVIRYSDPAALDVLTIYYTSGIAGEEDYEYFDENGDANLIPVIPNKYYEEVMRRAILYICDLGIAKFDQLKAQRYVRLMKRYTIPQEDLLPERGLEKDRPFIQVKAFSLSFPGD